MQMITLQIPVYTKGPDKQILIDLKVSVFYFMY